MFVLLELDDHGEPCGDGVFGSLADARTVLDGLNESGDGDPYYRVFELTEVD